MVAYFFPPMGGAGVQRSLKFAKYLPREGWDPTVITVRALDYWMADGSLAEELGAGVRVVRTGSLTGVSLLRRIAPGQAGRPGRPRASAKSMGLLRSLASWVLLPDTYRGWVPFARRAAARLLRQQPHDLIYTTSSPDSSHLVGLSLARRFGLPWVADFRDPWTRRLSFRAPTRWHARRQHKMERAVLQSASLITVTAEETRGDYLRLYPELPPEKIQVVTNGFDEEDFNACSGLSPGRDRMQVLHAGQLNPERPARPFLEGMRLLLDAQPDARRRMLVRFIGPFYGGDAACARHLGLEDLVRFEPVMPHREVVAEMMRSHLLLLMEQDSERGGLILPGKLFEYLRARRPILGLLPPGAAWNLIARLRAGGCCRPGDAEGIARTLAAYLRQYDEGGPAGTSISDEELLTFERTALARRLASLIGPLVRRG